MAATNYEIVMEDRKKLVNRIIENMKKGYIWSPKAWNSKVLRPHNPVSGCHYLGGNRVRLTLEALRNNYQDPRWMTYRQAKKNGWAVKRGARSVLLEKWIFTETKTVKNEFGEKVEVENKLPNPKVYYFRVFNAEQIHGIPELKAMPDISLDQAIHCAQKSSQCDIQDSLSGHACYIPVLDKIILPPQ